jgi:hypothetical protein
MVAPDNAPLIVPRDEAAMAAAFATALTHNAGPANQDRARAEYDAAAMFTRYRSLLGCAPR